MSALLPPFCAVGPVPSGRRTKLWTLSKGGLSLTEFGIFGSIGDEYIPTGFNTWGEYDGKLAIGEVTEKDIFRIEGTDKVMRGIDVPPEFWECNDRQEQEGKLKRNLRAILQLFNIKVFVFPERVEIKGAIPTQVLELSTKKKTQTASIANSPSPSKERGKIIKRGTSSL